MPSTKIIKGSEAQMSKTNGHERRIISSVENAGMKMKTTIKETACNFLTEFI